jgi:hypothetical protein
MSSVISIQIQVVNLLIFMLIGYSTSIIIGRMGNNRKLNSCEFLLYASFILYVFIVDNAGLIHNITNYLWYFHGAVMLATELQLGLITLIQIGRYYKRTIYNVTAMHLFVINAVITCAFSAWSFVGQNAFVKDNEIVYTHNVITVTITSIYHVVIESIMQYCIYRYISSIKGLKTKASLILKLCLLSSFIFVSWLIILPILNMTVKNQNLVFCYRIDILVKCMIISLPRFLSGKNEDQSTVKGVLSVSGDKSHSETYYDKTNLIELANTRENLTYSEQSSNLSLYRQNTTNKSNSN